MISLWLINLYQMNNNSNCIYIYTKLFFPIKRILSDASNRWHIWKHIFRKKHLKTKQNFEKYSSFQKDLVHKWNLWIPVLKCIRKFFVLKPGIIPFRIVQQPLPEKFREVFNTKYHVQHLHSGCRISKNKFWYTSFECQIGWKIRDYGISH